MNNPNMKIEILIVDDDPSTGKLLKTILSRKYPEAVINFVFEPGSVLNGFKKNMPDILITDFIMPELNGIQLAREIKGKNPATKVIMLSGISDPKSFAGDAAESVIDYLMVKPINFDLLFSAINSCLAKSGASG